MIDAIVKLYVVSNDTWRPLENASKTFSCRPTISNKKLSYHGDSARCVKRSFRVTQGDPLLCQSTRHMWLPISIQ